MATLNLGRIKPVFQGAYNNSTAYIVDDIVTFGDETFICIQASTGNATSNASYWTKLAAKGTDGTDVGTTLTTQGDILYRDGSGLARLGYGTAGQVLKTGGSGANPSWGTLSSDYVKLHQTVQTSDVSAVSLDGHFTSDYRIYKIFAETKLGGSQSGNAQVQMKFNLSGSAFGGAYYNWTLNESYISSSASVTNRHGRDDTSFAQLQGTWNPTDTVHDNEYYEITIYNPLNTTTGKMIKWLGSYAQGSSSIYVSTEGMGYFESTTATTGVTFQRDNSNQITGTFTLYGIKG